MPHSHRHVNTKVTTTGGGDSDATYEKTPCFSRSTLYPAYQLLLPLPLQPHTLLHVKILKFTCTRAQPDTGGYI